MYTLGPPEYVRRPSCPRGPSSPRRRFGDIRPLPVTAFPDRLRAARRAAGSCLCVGLDPDARDLPARYHGLADDDAVAAFCDDLIRATAPVACAYKPNAAFFEALGERGHAVLASAIEAVRRHAPEALVVYDAKRGDVGHTAAMYARAAFETLGADAATVSPYMGADAVAPFLAHAGRAAFVLARTSNPSAGAVQALSVEASADAPAEPLFHRIVRAARSWGEGAAGTVGFVAGATDAAALADIRRLAPDAPLLVPGVGAQGGDAAAVMQANAGGPILVSVSRAIARADDPATASRHIAAQLVG